MPRLVLVRHAKSAYPDDTDDFDRPLALRGIREAPLAGRWLAEHVGAPDRVIVSATLRTMQTWELIDTEVDFAGPLTIDPRVYEATPAQLLEILHEVPDSTNTLVLVGHNPGLELLVTWLCSGGDAQGLDAVRTKFPTCAIALISFEGSWRDLRDASARLDSFAVVR